MFSRVLCADDFSDDTCVVSRTALKVAQTFGVELVLHHVNDALFRGLAATDALAATGFLPPFFSDEFPDATQESTRTLAARIDALGAPGKARVSGRVTYGPIASTLMKDVASHPEGDTLLVVGKRGQRHLYDSLLGSVATRLVEAGVAPTLVIPARPQQTDWTPKSVVVATSLHGSWHEREHWGQDFARAFGAQLHLVHVSSRDTQAPRGAGAATVADVPTPDRELLYAFPEDAQARALQEKAGDATALLLHGDPAATFLDYVHATRPDLVVVGHTVRNGRGGPLGVFTERLLRDPAAPPVLVVPHARTGSA